MGGRQANLSAREERRGPAGRPSEGKMVVKTRPDGGGGAAAASPRICTWHFIRAKAVGRNKQARLDNHSKYDRGNNSTAVVRASSGGATELELATAARREGVSLGKRTLAILHPRSQTGVPRGAPRLD